MGDDRPKKSWREIDQMRSKGGSRRRDDTEFRRDRASKTAAYSAYKSQLDKLFTPGGAALPEHMRAKLGPQSEESKALREATENLKNNPGEDSLRAYLDGGFELPNDPRLLMSLTDVRDETLLQPVLKQLLDLVEDGKKPNRMLLMQRLQTVENFAEDDETLDLVKMIRAVL